MQNICRTILPLFAFFFLLLFSLCPECVSENPDYASLTDDEFAGLSLAFPVL